MIIKAFGLALNRGHQRRSNCFFFFFEMKKNKRKQNKLKRSLSVAHLVGILLEEIFFFHFFFK